MDFKKLLKPYEEVMMKTLFDFIRIDSVYDEKSVTKGKPFGEGVFNALEFVAKLGEKYGFKVDRCDGYATELTIGEGGNTIGIYAHSDVVPISGNWKRGAFDPYIENGNIYGRGSSDDKGPLIAAFFAIVALREAGLLKGYNIRFVSGGDEERGSGCLEHYFEVLKKPYPDYGFTPDSDFPLIYGEKGIINFYPTLKLDIPELISIHGGVATNAVNDKTDVVVKNVDEFEAYLKSQNINYSRKENVITFIGKSVHGSTPAGGVNAALIALKCLGDFYKVEKLVKIGEKLSDTSGKSFNGFTSTKLLGETTYCVGLIDYENGKLTFSVNFRYPESVKASKYRDNFDKYFGTVSSLSEESHYLLYEPSSKLVSTLYKVYQEESGDYKTPVLTTGGGTYAKHAKNTIAFGALFPGRESTMHEPNELMPVEDFYLSAVIYARAIDELGKLK